LWLSLPRFIDLVNSRSFSASPSLPKKAIDSQDPVLRESRSNQGLARDSVWSGPKGSTREERGLDFISHTFEESRPSLTQEMLLPVLLGLNSNRRSIPGWMFWRENVAGAFAPES
jgi:hypothetical protein